MTFDALLELFEQRIPAHPWAQITLYVLALVLLAGIAQWLVARVVGRVVYRVLSLSGHGNWAGALLRHRTYRRLGYAVFLAVVTVGISQVPNLGKFSEAIERLAHAGTWISVFLMLSGVLDAWQTVFSSSRSAQTHSIRGYIQVPA